MRLCSSGGEGAEAFLGQGNLAQLPGVLGDSKQVEVLLGPGAVVQQGRQLCLADLGLKAGGSWEDLGLGGKSPVHGAAGWQLLEAIAGVGCSWGEKFAAM